MIKIALKLLKYGLVLYLMIFIKNLYSENINSAEIITVRTPDIIDLDDVSEVEEEEPIIFAETMEFYSPENQAKLKKQMEIMRQLNSGNGISTIESYRDSLEQGLLQENSQQERLPAKS